MTKLRCQLNIETRTAFLDCAECPHRDIRCEIYAQLVKARQERDEARDLLARWDGELAKVQGELREAKGDHTDEERIEGLVTGAQVLKAANDRAGDLQKELDELQKEFVAMQERAHHAELRIARMVREGWVDEVSDD